MEENVQRDNEKIAISKFNATFHRYASVLYVESRFTHFIGQLCKSTSQVSERLNCVVIAAQAMLTDK